MIPNTTNAAKRFASVFAAMLGLLLMTSDAAAAETASNAIQRDLGVLFYLLLPVLFYSLLVRRRRRRHGGALLSSRLREAQMRGRSSRSEA